MSRVLVIVIPRQSVPTSECLPCSSLSRRWNGSPWRPLGSDAFIKNYLQNKIQSCTDALRPLQDIPDARIRFHLHPGTGSVCRVEHTFRLTPSILSLLLAVQFDELQRATYSRLNDVPLPASTSFQIGLPLRMGVHGFSPLSPFVHAFYAASLLEAAPIRAKGPANPSVPFYSGMGRRHLVRVLATINPEIRTRVVLSSHSPLGPFELDALLDRPERVHTTLFQALHGAFSRMYWEKSAWDRLPSPSDHTLVSVRRRARYNSLCAPGAASFFCAHPALASRVSNEVWSGMLRRHSDSQVYDDSIQPLLCSHCRRPMDIRGDHAAMCRHGFGTVHRHNTVRNTLARHAFRAAGLSCDMEVAFLIPGTAHRPADLLVQPAPPPAGALPDRPTAYDVTVRSPYRVGALIQAARGIAGAAEVADADKLRTHGRIIRSALHREANAALPLLDWHFVPLTFDTLGAPSACSTSVLESLAHQIAIRTGTIFGTAKSRLSQRLSYAIWSSVASATVARMPYHGAALSCPAQV